jgi:N-acetylneuraminic acid mutarotase
MTVLSVSVHAQTPNSWVKKNDFGGGKREQAVAFSIGNFGYVATGVDTAEIVLKDLWQYNEDLDSWTQKADMPGVGRRCAFGFALNGKGYVGGGIDNDEAQAGVRLADFYEYDPVTNTWIAKANYPAGDGLGVYYATGFSVDNKGYVCGGKVGPNSYLSQVWEYKPLNNSWSQRSNFPGGVRYNLSSVVVGNVAFVGLGTNQDTYCKDWWRYNPGSNTWVQMTDFVGGYRGGASTFTIGTKAYVCLGTNGGLKEDLFMYNPANDNWYPRANYGGSERKQAIAFTIGNHAYVGTGGGVSGKKVSMYEYIPLDVLTLDELASEVRVFPNPASDIIHVSSQYVGKQHVLLFGPDGRIMREFEQVNTEFAISCSDLPSGTYHLYIEFDGNESIAHKTIQIVR